jgi:hypothetical protein
MRQPFKGVSLDITTPSRLLFGCKSPIRHSVALLWWGIPEKYAVHMNQFKTVLVIKNSVPWSTEAYTLSE